MKKLSYASVVELIRFLRPVVWGFHIHLPTVGEYENLKLLAKILLVQHQMHKILIVVLPYIESTKVIHTERVYIEQGAGSISFFTID